MVRLDQTFLDLCDNGTPKIVDLFWNPWNQNLEETVIFIFFMVYNFQKLLEQRKFLAQSENPPKKLRQIWIKVGLAMQ